MVICFSSPLLHRLTSDMSSRRSLPSLASRPGRPSCEVSFLVVSIYVLIYELRMTVPPNTLAALSIWAAAYLAAKYRMRAPFIIAAGGIAIVG